MMDSETRELLRGSLRAVLGERSDRPLTDRLGDLGWDEVLEDDAPTAQRTLFEIKGELLSSDDALGPLLARAIADATTLAGPEAAPTGAAVARSLQIDTSLTGTTSNRYRSVGTAARSEVARAGSTATVRRDDVTSPRTLLAAATLVLPSSLHPDRPSARLAGGGLAVEGVVLRAPDPGAALIVPVADDEEVRLALVEGVGLAGTPVAGIDPDMGLVAVAGRFDPSAVTWIKGPDAAAAWDAAVTCGRWALAAELVGIGQRVIAEAVEYTIERTQYGRPIGSFQALQHRLAGAHASVVGASHVVAEAAATGSPWTALVAKSLAGHAAEDACTQAQQSYGAIGFTWEHDFHRSLRRVYILDRLLGGWRELEAEIGRRLQDTRRVPQIGTI